MKLIINTWYYFIIIFCFLFCETKPLSAETSEKEITKDILKEGLENFQKPYGSWTVKNKQLILETEQPHRKRRNIWIKGEYQDFILELDFKLAKGANSGVFMRTVDIDDPVQTGIEVQIRDDHGKSPIDKKFCGSIYDIKEVSENRVKKSGKWNRLKIICEGKSITVYLNKGKVIDIDLSDWKEAGKNPDGTKNKYKTAYKDMAEIGKIGFQDHGGKVWYRNICIKEL